MKKKKKKMKKIENRKIENKKNKKGKEPAFGIAIFFFSSLSSRKKGGWGSSLAGSAV